MRVRSLLMKVGNKQEISLQCTCITKSDSKYPKEIKLQNWQMYTILVYKMTGMVENVQSTRVKPEFCIATTKSDGNWKTDKVSE